MLFAAALMISAMQQPSAAADPYTLYAILPLTGPGAFVGQAERQALQVLQEIVNRGGGIRGRAVQFVVQDSQTSPQVAVQLANGITSKGVPIVIGDTSVATCTAMAPVLKNTVVQFCLSAGFQPAKGSYSYVIGASLDVQANAILRYFRSQGWKRIALLNATDATGAVSETAFKNAFGLPENRELTIVADERFNPTDISVSAQVVRIRAANAQAIVSFVSGQPFGTVVRGLRDADLRLPVVTTQANLSYAAMRSLGDAVATDVLFCLGPLPPAGEPVAGGPLQAAQKAYLNAFSVQGIKPEYGHAVVWDTGSIIVAALRKLGTDATATQIRDFVNGVHDYPAVQGMLDFRTGDMRGVSDLRILRWDRVTSNWKILR